MYHLSPYKASGATGASNGLSDNNHNPNHCLPGERNVSDDNSNNHVRCNNCNPDRLLPDDSRNGFYNAATYNLIICNKFNPDQMF